MSRIESRFDLVDGRQVLMDGEPLDLVASLAVYNHSPSGFSWGYGGSGPSQLALAILLRVTDDETALTYHQRFKWEHVAQWPEGDPIDVDVDVRAWLATVQADNEQRDRRREHD